MSFNLVLVSSLLALAASTAAPLAQAQVNVFNTAFLQPLPGQGNGGGVVLNGFGRNTSRPDVTETPDSATAASTAFLGGSSAFFDTWNLGTTGVAPGVYSFSNLAVDAFGGATFIAVTFNSYDAAGLRNTVLFNLNGSGTQATGSGQFTVLSSCPVQSCVWIDVIGLQPGSVGSGYGGTGTALPVPEPASWALLGLGVAALAGVASKRRRADPR